MEVTQPIAGVTVRIVHLKYHKDEKDVFRFEREVFSSLSARHVQIGMDDKEEWERYSKM